MTDTTSLLEAQQEIHRKMEEMKTELKTLGEKLFKEGSQDIFDTFPDIHSFSWTQYTPYFNDGEPCEFSVNHYFTVYGGDEYPLYEEISYYPNWIQRKLDRGEELTEEEKLGQTLGILIGSIDNDTMLALFGDHARVTVTREGIDVEEYEHD
jgi:restriction endonuclease S subunit